MTARPIAAVFASKPDPTWSLVEQFNGGTCERCGGRLAETPYVGGDHDPICECTSCGRHYGCGECDVG